jgi:hypothetical protein|tara:strand:- start:257 stop:1468 length:1212 start_codon:yes stop_codon:yes gene_type:complete
MHVLESYALQNDLKIDKAVVYEKYFPLAVDKFITIDTSTLGTSSLAYDHWQLVVDLIHSQLEEEGIKIIQLGDKNCTPLHQCYITLGQCNFNQRAYIVGKSLIHICPNNESSHVASHYNKKSIVLFSNNCYLSQFSPYWTDRPTLDQFKRGESRAELLQPPIHKRPSFNPNENPKSINSIKPEVVAEKILKQLDIHTFVPEFETVKIGSSFHRPRTESTLTHLLDAKKFGVSSLIIRMDLNFNEEVLRKQLESCECSIITNRPLSDETLNKYHKKIVELVYYIEDDNDPSFIRKVKEKSMTYLLRSNKDEEQTNDFKLDYMDYGLVNQMPTRSQGDFEELKGLENLYYKSTHFIIHNNKFYPSTAAYLRNTQGSPSMQHDPYPVIDDPLFWGEEEHFHFFVKK